MEGPIVMKTAVSQVDERATSQLPTYGEAICTTVTAQRHPRGTIYKVLVQNGDSEHFRLGLSLEQKLTLL